MFVFQVNSKGYKVCGEASSVCGTITINKRKVGVIYETTVWNVGDLNCHILAFIFFCFCFNKFEEMNSEMEESKELADNRLIELQKLQQDLQNVHQENTNMKVFLLFSY